MQRICGLSVTETIIMPFPTLCHLWHSLIRSLYFRACLPEGVGPQEGEVTCGGSTHLTCKRDHIKMRDCMDRRVTSTTWGPPPPCKQALIQVYIFIPLLYSAPFLRFSQNLLYTNFFHWCISPRGILFFLSQMMRLTRESSEFNFYN